MKNLRATILLISTLLLSWRGQGAEFNGDPSGHHLLLKGKPFFWLAGNEGAGQDCAMRTPERNAFIFYLTSTNQITLSLGSPGGSASFSAKWINPATGEERQAGKLSAEQATLMAPS